MLDVVNLTRRFAQVCAVDSVTFSVSAGGLTGFVGGNGAGKTTTMRMIMGILAVHGGQVHWQGRLITAADRASFGYMPEERGLYPKQPVLDQLVYLGRLHRMSPATARASVWELLERFGLQDRAKDKVETLSLGNQQRVQIAAAVLAEPVALILDEPFSGLDPLAVDAMADLLREHANRDVPVLFSSHQLELVERLCDRLIILAEGRVVAQGSVADLRNRGPVRHRLVLDREAAWTRTVPGILVSAVNGPEAILQIHEPGAERALLDAALARGSVVEFRRLTPSLSEVFREVTA